MNTQLKIFGAVAGVVLIIGIAVFFTFSRTSSPSQVTEVPVGFGIGDERTVIVPNSEETGENEPVTTSQNQQKVFKVLDGPVTSAILIQSGIPTTTTARYVLQENGHVLDLVLDSAGTVPRAVSNTTIPGTVHTKWAGGGAGAILQYLDNSTVKTLYLGFPQATTTATATQPIRVQFFPDNITDIAVSPTGEKVAYLLETTSGATGYTANVDGSGSAQLFSLPLRDILLSWPAPANLLAQTKSAANVPGVVFSINVSNGNVIPLLYAPGVTAIANSSFNRIVYQTIAPNRAPFTFIRNTQTGVEAGVSFDPIPEKCTWSASATSTMYCAVPIEYTPPDYLGLWHQGAASLADAIIAYDVETSKSTVIATPGSEGGVASDIAEMSVSGDGRYLLFIKKGDRSLWGVRLAQ